MKPDVLKQIKEIEANRAQMIKEQEEIMKQNGPIMLNREGQPPIQLSNQQVVQIIQQNQTQIHDLTKKNGEQQRFIQLLQQKITDLNKKKGITTTHDNNTEIQELTKKNKELQDKITEMNENERLISQIKILTERNNIIEEKLIIEQGRNQKLENIINTKSMPVPVKQHGKSYPEVFVNIND